MMDILNGCDICGESHATELCPELGLNNASVQLYQLSTKARLTLPSFVEVVDDGNGFVGVVAKSPIPSKTQFGPYEAKRTTHIFDDTGFFTVKVIGKDGTMVCLDTTDENECNWLCLIRAAASEPEKNCIAYQLGSNIFYHTTRDIGTYEELQVWYAPHFAKKLGKPPHPDGISRVLLGHRIEPLTSDLLLANAAADGESYQDTTEVIETLTETSNNFPAGEIIKAFYCPRCGNTFPNQTEMVQHLREHVLATNPKPKRSVGRPRKDGRPNESKSNERHPVQQASWKSRSSKSILESVLTENEFKVKPPTKTYSRKRKASPDKSNERVEDDDDESIDETSAEAERGGDDREYTPRKEVDVKGRRVQPRRSTRGHHSRFDHDYVLFNIKKEKVEPTEEEIAKQLKETAENEARIAEGSKAFDVVTVDDIKKSLPLKEATDTDERNGNVTVDKVECSDNADELSDLVKAETKESNNEADAVMEESSVEDEREPVKKGDLIVNAETEPIEKGDLSVKGDTNQVKEVDLIDEDDLSVKGDTNQAKKVDSNDDSPVEMKSSTPDENRKSARSGSTFIRRDVTTAEKGSMVVMFEETEDGKFTCVLCEETFTEETVAVAHFMTHDSGDMKCRKCDMHFESVVELLKHRGKCNNETAPEGTMQHVCDICQQAFKSAQYLFRHMVIHTDVFKCEKCEKTFSRKDSMQKHILKCCPHLAEKYKIFYCEVCFRVFSKESGRKRHVEKCKSVQCNTCNKIFSSLNDMVIHACKSHDADDTAKYCCGRCSKAFQSLYYLKQHQSMHDNNHACNQCGKTFSSPDELTSHMSVCETLEGIRLYGSAICLICKETFSNSKLFKLHHMTHTHPFHCEKCDKRFLRFGQLNNHECETSSDWVCSVCNKSFRHQVNLDKHIKENGCMKYQCSICNEQFHTKLQAKDHSCIVDAAAEVEAQIVSKVPTKEICATCGKWFSNRSNLSKHMILHGEKKLACPHCPKKFHLDVYLREHITCVHFKIFKYQCNECGRLLKSKTGLIAHNRIFHAKNAETYPCSKCSKVFKQKGNLRAHMYSHSCERKFKCELCARAFKYPDQLSRHKIEHKMMPKLKCSHCEKEFLRSYDLKKHLQVYHSGYIYTCGVCAARCGHRHTLVRHYKRKHPESVHLTRQEGYLDGLLKHVDELYESQVDVQHDILATRKYKLGKITKEIETVDEIIKNAEILPADAAEALHSLSIGQATAEQFQILKEKGLFIQNEEGILKEQNGNILGDENQVVVPQDSYIFENQSLEQSEMIESTEEVATSSSEGLSETIGMVQNPDGSISINGIHSIPQAIQNVKAQIVILQIYPGSGTQQQPNEIILNQEQVFQQGANGEIIPHTGQVLNDGSQILPHSQIQTILIENDGNQIGSSIDLPDDGDQVGEDDNMVKVEETVDDNVNETDSEIVIETVDDAVTEEETVDGTVDEVQAEVVDNTTGSADFPEGMDVEVETHIEDGDPIIQAPMVYSQDVSCTE